MQAANQQPTTKPSHGCDPQLVAQPPALLRRRRAGELLSQLTDEDVDDLATRLIHAAIEMVEQHFLGQGGALAQAEEFQHLVLLACEAHPRAVWTRATTAAPRIPICRED
jgi:hypothetical protein